MNIDIIDNCLSKFYNNTLHNLDLVDLEEERKSSLINASGERDSDFVDSSAVHWSASYKFLIRCIDEFIKNPCKLTANELNKSLQTSHANRKRNTDYIEINPYYRWTKH
jgi:hypothetical protein